MQRYKNYRKHESGVSEVIGAVLLIALVVSAIAIIGVGMFSQPVAKKIPALDAVISLTGNTIQITHNGGDTLQKADFVILVNGVPQSSETIFKGTDSSWQSLSPGESLTIYSTDPDSVRIVYTGQSASALLSSATFGGVNPAQAAYTILASAGYGGTISPTGSVPAVYGDIWSFVITPNTGSKISDVLVDGVSVGPVAGYTFERVTASHTIAASFSIATYTISASAGDGGTISPTGSVPMVYLNNSPMFTIEPNAHYRIADVLVDGESQGVITNYTFLSVVADHTIDALFAIDTFTITPSIVGGNGTVSPDTVQTVDYGATPTFDFTPDIGYNLNTLTINGNPITPTGNSYTFPAVTSNQTIVGTFAINTYTINATAGPNGTVTPAGETIVIYNSNQTYTITPDTDYHIADVLIDSGSSGMILNYTFTNVQENHTISATFMADPPVANFTGTPRTGPVPLVIAFTDRSTKNPTSWLWDFGDGNTSTAQNPSNTYWLAGNYSVQLTATNAGGSNTSLVNGYIFAYVPAVANFTGTPTSGPMPLSVSFSDLSTGSPSSWYWDFGDNSITGANTQQNPGHTYQTVGLFSVNLTVANTFSSSSLLRTAYINATSPPPEALFEAFDPQGVAPLEVFFLDESSNTPTSWLWHFDDGTADVTSQDATHTFTNAGTYNVSLTATNTGGSSTYYLLITAFAAPTVTSVAPAIGTPLGSNTVTIIGTNLIGATAATFGGTSATGVSVINATAVTAITPAHASGLVYVNVTTPNGTAIGPNVFTYAAAPTVTSVAPASGTTLGGTTVTILGTNLIGATAATFGNISATGVSVINATAITATTPARASSGLVYVNVTTPNGTAIGPNVFTYVYPAPTVSSVTPATGGSLGGTSVTILGTNLIGATAAIFGGNSTSVSVINATAITAITPAHAAGAVYVNVTTPNGTASLSNAFTYFIPTVTSVVPASGSTLGGTSVTILGTNLIGATAATFGGNASTSVLVVNSTVITAITPAGAGVVSVIVTTPNGTATGASVYTYVTPPTVTSVAPASGSTLGGTSVTILGTNLIGATVATFGGNASTSVLVVNSTAITAITPAGAGVVSVNVTTPNGTATGTNLYTYRTPPTVTSVYPAKGPIAGATVVTILGTNLIGANAGGANGVTFDGLSGTSVSVLNATAVRVTTPAHAAGWVNVNVTTPNGTSTTADKAYRYYEIKSFPPSTGPWTVPANVDYVEYLVVAGGGGGGRYGAGGGAGGFLNGTLTGLSGPQIVTVGGGGAGGTVGLGTSGSNSVFSSITATGGGGGAGNNNIIGSNGGSGGGGFRSTGTVGANTTGQGFAGGMGFTYQTNRYNGGGGGGASVVGDASTASTDGGYGGAGKYSDISGSNTQYACGGGGGGRGAAGTGGCATAGDGRTGNNIGTSATANFGGGGGGGGNTANGGAGGSGIVIIKFY